MDDHDKESWEGGDSQLDNCRVLGRLCCHRPKSIRATKRRSKADAAAKKHANIRKPSRLRNEKWKRKVSGETVLR
jgi:hypothetical protein